MQEESVRPGQFAEVMLTCVPPFLQTVAETGDIITPPNRPDLTDISCVH